MTFINNNGLVYIVLFQTPGLLHMGFFIHSLHIHKFTGGKLPATTALGHTDGAMVVNPPLWPL